MEPLPIIIYRRIAPNDYVEGYAAALLINTTLTHVNFLTETWLSPALGKTYYVMTRAEAEQPPQFRELNVYAHPGAGAFYNYTIELGPAWSGKIKLPEPKNNNEA